MDFYKLTDIEFEYPESLLKEIVKRSEFGSSYPIEHIPTPLITRGLLLKFIEIGEYFDSDKILEKGLEKLVDKDFLEQAIKLDKKGDILYRIKKLFSNDEESIDTEYNALFDTDLARNAIISNPTCYQYIPLQFRNNEIRELTLIGLKALKLEEHPYAYGSVKGISIMYVLNKNGYDIKFDPSNIESAIKYILFDEIAFIDKIPESFITLDVIRSLLWHQKDRQECRKMKAKMVKLITEKGMDNEFVNQVRAIKY